MSMQIRVRRDGFNDAILVAVLEMDFQGRVNAYAKRPEMMQREGNSLHLPIEPFAELDTTAAQRLMDELWSCGIRPTEGRGSAGSLAATERHLDDMRRIAFGALMEISDNIKMPNERGGRNK